VNPASKLQVFRKERQPGTGKWLFDLPEMSAWLESPNSALWIYGIPGAGKTILSTLVIDEVLTRKRSSSIGTAYFHVRHDDRNSQVPSNVLGSLISQLARQNSAALDDVVELHAQHRREGGLTTTLEEDDLIQLLFDIFKHFIDTFIMIDGLDECLTVFDRDRKRLIDCLTNIHRKGNCPVHTLIFSRDELDIRKSLTVTEFQVVSIAAKSADLCLYVNAWLPSLDIQSEILRVEVVDTLVEKANGM
jgi:Cdc6-like AAA superfamily ATPase